MERRPVGRGLLVGLALVATAVLLGAGAALRHRVVRSAAPVRDTVATLAAPPDARVRVEVLNATTTRGLAQRATRFLRDRGFDVVDLGNASHPVDTVVVIDRSSRPDVARRVAEAFGGAVIENRPDSLRYVDVTVLVGRSWRPPASSEPFDP